MSKYVLVGCDLHDKTILLKMSVNKGVAEKRSFENSRNGRRVMIGELKRRGFQYKAQVVFAYEASGLGFGLHDELTENGICCHVLAPSKIERSPKQRRCKTDEKDAEHILEILRGHYLGGNKLPDIWIPDLQTRDDRELVRARLDAQDKCSAVKTQVRTLLKRKGVSKPKDAGDGWTKEYWSWLQALTECDLPLAYGARQNLASLLRQIRHLEKEVERFDREIGKLARTPRYRAGMKALLKLKGVGPICAIVFLTEMGDPRRFSNRRQIGAFLGLVPASDETGEADDRKGHITHQGPPRVRHVLNQAVWNRVRFDPDEKKVYERIAAKNPKHKKIAVVAAMRRLAIRMWHLAKEAKAVS